MRTMTMGVARPGVFVASVLAASLSVPGCQPDDGNPLGAAGATAVVGSGAGTAAADDVGFEATVLPLIDEACRCHQTEPILMAPLSLKRGEAYDNLVSVPALQLASMARVEPGSLNASYLWHKLNGTQAEVGGSGKIMPSTLPLSQAEREVFGRWIAAGAPR